MRIRIRPIYRLTRAIKAFFAPVLLGPRDICNYPEESKEVLSGMEDEVVEVKFPGKLRIRCRKAWYELSRSLILAEAVPGPELAKEIMPYMRGRDPRAVQVQKSLDGLDGVALAKGIEERLDHPRPLPPL